jgi:hypothetical protein
MDHQKAAHDTERNIIQTRCDKDDTCSICYDDMFRKTVLYTPCGHIFHNNCLKKWMETLKNPVTCPCCRTPIPGLLKYKYIYLGQYDDDLDVIFTNLNQFQEDNIIRESIFEEIREGISHFIPHTDENNTIRDNLYNIET